MAIVIHTIGRNQYAYEHTRVGATVKSTYLGRAGGTSITYAGSKTYGSNEITQQANTDLSDFEYSQIQTAMDKTAQYKIILNDGVYKDGILLKDGFSSHYDADNYMRQQWDKEPLTTVQRKYGTPEQKGFEVKTISHKKTITNLDEVLKVKNDMTKKFLSQKQKPVVKEEITQNYTT